MSEPIARLQGLLDRVRRNAAKARSVPAPTADAPARAAADARAPQPVASLTDRSPAASPEPRATESVSERPTRTEPRWPVPAEVPSRQPEARTLSGVPAAGSDAPTAGELDLPGSAAFFVEEPAASSQRPRVTAGDDFEEPFDARPVPLVTPPPESGPQRSASQHTAFADEAPAPAAQRHSLGVPRLPSDLVGPPADTIDPPAATVEQLGQTVDLGEPVGPALELAVPAAAGGARAEEASDDLEMALPTGFGGGTYDESLMPPPSVHEDLRRHRERADRYSVIPLQAAPPVELTAQRSVVQRPVPPDSDVAIMVSPAQRSQSVTFIEWLEASLALRAK